MRFKSLVIQACFVVALVLGLQSLHKPLPIVTANAGGTQTIERSQGYVILDASASTGTNLTYTWTLVNPSNQPEEAWIDNPNGVIAQAHVLPYGSGVWKFALAVTDGVTTARDTCVVNMTWANPPPQAASYRLLTAADTAALNVHNHGLARPGDYYIDGANNGINLPGGKLTDIYTNGFAGVTFTPGMRLLINCAGGGAYGNIQLNFNAANITATHARPLVVCGINGQLEATSILFTNAKNVEFTGKYVPGYSGDDRYKGWDNGGVGQGYGFQSGTFGVYINNRWTGLGGACITFSGTGTDSCHMHDLEFGNGAFAGIFMKEHNTDSSHVWTCFRGMEIDSTYGHDTDGEMLYAGDTGDDCYYPQSGTIVGGSGYTNGTYNVTMTGGSGSGAFATIVVSGGSVVSVSIAVGNGGCGYKNGDNLTASLPGGSGFHYNNIVCNWMGQHTIQGLRLHDNIWCRSGNELSQIGDQGGDCQMYNNTFWLGATRWKTPFDESQDQSQQDDYRNGGNKKYNNIIIGAGEYHLNTFSQYKHRSGSDPAFVSTASEVYNNLFLLNRGFIDNFCKMIDTVNAQTISVHNNYWGMSIFSADQIFQSTDVRAINTQEVFRVFVQVSNNHISYNNNTTDNTKTGSLSGSVSPQIDTSGNSKVSSLKFPAFANTGAAYLGLTDSMFAVKLAGGGYTYKIYATHGDEYNILNCGKATCCGVRQCTPWIYQAGDLCIWESKIYKSRINNNSLHTPYPGDSTYWQVQQWVNTRTGQLTFTPPDDLRLYSSDQWAVKGMGISAVYIPSSVFQNFTTKRHRPLKLKVK